MSSKELKKRLETLLQAKIPSISQRAKSVGIDQEPTRRTRRR